MILRRKGRSVNERYAKSKRYLIELSLQGGLKNPHVATLVSDVYTHTTYGEGGLSLALLEVMGIGKPIVASRVEGIPEAIRHPLEGTLIENEVSQIASPVTYLIENPKLRQEMSWISGKAVNKRFSWKKLYGN